MKRDPTTSQTATSVLTTIVAYIFLKVLICSSIFIDLLTDYVICLPVTYISMIDAQF
jgi:hypothetical protein